MMKKKKTYKNAQFGDFGFVYSNICKNSKCVSGGQFSVSWTGFTRPAELGITGIKTIFHAIKYFFNYYYKK